MPQMTTVLELFAGAGGMALGLEQAGLETIGLYEIDNKCVSTLQHNRPDWNVVHADVSKISFRGIKADVVVGGFPCQAFSFAGKKLGFEDTRGTLFFEFARAVKEINPKLFIAENVAGLVSHEKGKSLETMINVLEELGYQVQWKILNSVNYLVPQKRRRIFIVGTKPSLEFNFPEPIDDILTLSDALKDVPLSDGQSYSEKRFKILDLIPPGGSWVDLPLELQKEHLGKSFYSGGGKRGMARRISWDEPCLTLTTSPAQKQTDRCHPEETRPFTTREYARIQTFPDDWEFKGSMSSIYKQIGNAVPVRLAKSMGEEIIKSINNQGVSDKNIKQISKSLLLKALFENLIGDKHLTSHLIIDKLWPDEAREGSIHHGLRTSIGYCWEKIANELAKLNGFDVSENHLTPKKKNTALQNLMDAWKTKRKDSNAANKPVSLENYCNELDQMFSSKKSIDEKICRKFQKGQGSDLFWKKSGKYYIFDTKTVYPNADSGNKYDGNVIEWIGNLKYKLGQNVDAKNIIVKYIFPYNPYDWEDDSNWYVHFMDRAKPLSKEEIMVGNEFWGWVTGNKNTLKLIVGSIDQIKNDKIIMERLNKCISNITDAKRTEALKEAKFKNKILYIQQFASSPLDLESKEPLDGNGKNAEGIKFGTDINGNGNGAYSKWKHDNSCIFYAKTSTLIKEIHNEYKCPTCKNIV